MNKEIKRQLILSGILLCLLVSTLFLWYDNFMFHTYVNVVDYQYCFAGENEEITLDGYEFYKDNRDQKNGKARIMALQDRFFLEGDVVKTSFVLPNSEEESHYDQEMKIKTDNEVLILDEVETTQQLYEKDFTGAIVHMLVMRDDKIVYEKDIPMINQKMVVYNGGNKDYTIRNVYATASWLKTGDFSSTLQGIEKDYPDITIDYIYLKDNGNEDNLNDYERFANIKGKTLDVIEGKMKQAVYYDEQGSLLDRHLSCVVTLSKDNDSEKAYTFVVELNGTIKAVDGVE